MSEESQLSFPLIIVDLRNDVYGIWPRLQVKSSNMFSRKMALESVCEICVFDINRLIFWLYDWMIFDIEWEKKELVTAKYCFELTKELKEWKAENANNLVIVHDVRVVFNTEIPIKGKDENLSIENEMLN